jgi:SAM-dependent methyltransferase
MFIIPVLLSLALAQDPRLSAIQAEIAAADGAGQFYDRSYRPIEISFWGKILDWMSADAQSRQVKRILDIGCGYGTLLSYAAEVYQAAGYCVDVKDYLKPEVANKHRLQFKAANIELDPIPWSGRFDVIIMTEVLEHLNFQPVPTLTKIRNALDVNGRFFLSTPDAHDFGPQKKYHKHLGDFPMPSRKMKIVDDHMWVYSKSELEATLHAAGFVIEKLSYSPEEGIARHFNLVLRRMP